MRRVSGNLDVTCSPVAALRIDPQGKRNQRAGSHGEPRADLGLLFCHHVSAHPFSSRAAASCERMDGSRAPKPGTRGSSGGRCTTPRRGRGAPPACMHACSCHVAPERAHTCRLLSEWPFRSLATRRLGVSARQRGPGQVHPSSCLCLSTHGRCPYSC